MMSRKYGQEIADNCTILYGGSCNASNAKELFAKPNVDGGLIGGASLAPINSKFTFTKMVIPSRVILRIIITGLTRQGTQLPREMCIRDRVYNTLSRGQA